MSDDKTQAATETPRETISRRIRGLMAKTTENGCTEQEAITAAELARKLMDDYRITQTDIEIEAEPVTDSTIKRGKRQQVSAVDYCMPGIRAYCGVRMWYHVDKVDGRMVRHVRLIGLGPDVEMASYLYEMIGTAITASGWVYYRAELLPRTERTRGETRKAIESFEVGMGTRINQRLIDMAAALDATAKTGSGTALVVVKKPIIDAAFAKLGIAMRKTTAVGMRATDADAYEAGAEAGDQVNLQRPVGEAPAARRIARGTRTGKRAAKTA